MSAPKHRKAQPRHILAARAAALHAEGLNGIKIADRLGVSRSYAYQLLTDPTGDLNRKRKEQYYGTCENCGARTAYAQGGPVPLCKSCYDEDRTIWTPEAIVCAIQEWADDHGGIPPSANAWHYPAAKRGPYPSAAMVVAVCGWNNAIRAAGFEPHPTGPVGGYTPLTPLQRKQAARRYANGESSIAIAADLGCGPHIVTKWARRAGVPIRTTGGKVAA